MTATHIFCPSCQKLIKPTTIPAVGTRVRCPYCKAPFTLEDKFLVERRDPTPSSFPATISSATSQIPVAQVVNVPASSSSHYSEIEARQRQAPRPQLPAAQQRQYASANLPQNSEPVAKWVWIVGGTGVAVLLILAGMFATLLFTKSTGEPVVTAKNNKEDEEFIQLLTELQKQTAPNGQAADEQANAPASIPALAKNAQFKFDIKKGYKYEYDFEVTIGNLNGNQEPNRGKATYQLDERRAGRENLTNQAFRDKQSNGEMRVRYTGVLFSQNFMPEDGHGTITVSRDGNSIKFEDGQDLSLISTSVGALVFDQLPFNGANQWKSTRKRTIAFENENNFGQPPPGQPQFGRPQFGRPGGFARPPLRGPLNGQRNGSLFGPLTGRVTIDDSIDYEVETIDANQLTVKSKTTGAWTSEATGKVLSNSHGEGEYTFDRKQQIIVAGHSAYKFMRDINGIETSIPIHVAFKLSEALTPEQVRTKEDDREQKKVDGEKKDADELAKAIELIKNENADKEAIKQAMSKIEVSYGSSYNPITEQIKNEIAPHLNRWINHSDSYFRWDALRFTIKFGTEVNIPALLKVLASDSDSTNRGYAIEALGATGGNEQVAKMLAKAFKTDTYKITEALKKMPKYAEPFVIPLLEIEKSTDLDRVVEILEKIGGQDSLVAIEKLQAKLGNNRSNDYQIKRALKAIKERVAFQTK